MPLQPGTRLGNYEIRSSLGAGGMGEVYRAGDTKLGREVAIKVLPAEVAERSDWLDRFEREAKLLASLNHANIAAIYGLEEHGDRQCLVLGVRRKLRWQYLDRHVTVEGGVGRLPDDTHPALADAFDEFVVCECFARFQRHLPGV